MRLYALALTDAAGNQLLGYSTQNADGSNNGSALHLEFDIPEYAYGDPAGFASLKLYGIPYSQIQAASNFNDANIYLIAGMAKGLPLATPSQAGVILSATVQQCFGNWQGNEVSLELIAAPKAGTVLKPVNLSGAWKKGQTLESMVRSTLLIAFPKSVITGSFDPSLIYTEDQPFFYSTLQDFAKTVLDFSRSINASDSYRGAQITATPTGFRLFDGTSLPAAKEIRYLDLIGNATWLDAGTIQFKSVMRGDLKVGDVVRLPAGSNVVQTAAGQARYRNTTSFSGEFQIARIRHLGSSRQPDANSWATIVDCYAK